MYFNGLRIDDLLVASDGRVIFKFTEGNAPLPVSPGTEGIEFSSRQDFVAQMHDWVETLGPREKIFILIADALKADPTLRTTTLNAQRGRQIVVDFTSPAKVLST